MQWPFIARICKFILMNVWTFTVSLNFQQCTEWLPFCQELHFCQAVSSVLHVLSLIFLSKMIQVEKVSFLNKLPLPILLLRWVFNINRCFEYIALHCVTGTFADYLFTKFWMSPQFLFAFQEGELSIFCMK